MDMEPDSDPLDVLYLLCKDIRTKCVRKDGSIFITSVVTEALRKTIIDYNYDMSEPGYTHLKLCDNWNFNNRSFDGTRGAEMFLKTIKAIKTEDVDMVVAEVKNKDKVEKVREALNVDKENQTSKQQDNHKPDCETLVVATKPGYNLKEKRDLLWDRWKPFLMQSNIDTRFLMVIYTGKALGSLEYLTKITRFGHVLCRVAAEGQTNMVVNAFKEYIAFNKESIGYGRKAIELDTIRTACLKGAIFGHNDQMIDDLILLSGPFEFVGQYIPKDFEMNLSGLMETFTLYNRRTLMHFVETLQMKSDVYLRFASYLRYVAMHENEYRYVAKCLLCFIEVDNYDLFPYTDDAEKVIYTNPMIKNIPIDNDK